MKQLIQEIMPFWPQLFIIISVVGREVRDWVLTGTERNITFSYMNTSLLLSFHWWVVYVGGFFNHLGWPQYIYLILQIFITLVFVFIVFNPEKITKNKTTIVKPVSLGNLFLMFLFYCGGFFDSLITYLKS